MPLTVERTSPTTLVVTRRFAAPPERVFQAHTDPALLRRWMGGYGGWALTACEHDARPGGAVRHRFEAPDGAGAFEITGTYEVVEPPRDGRPGRTVHLEIMHLPDPTPPNRVETLFEPVEGGTLLTMTMSVETAEAMDAMVASGMSDGMEWTYARLDALETAEA